MPLPVPNLDDRHFQDFVDEAKRRIPSYCPDWTDHNVSDPGVTLIELFAWMTEQYIFRLNQVPDKNYLAFLNLIGAGLKPAVPARGEVTFTLAAAPVAGRRAIIPAWTEVATRRTETEEAVIFTTDREAEAVPPELTWLLTSTDEVDFTDQSATLKAETPFAVWGDPPQSSHAFYIGLDADLSAHTLELQLLCEDVGIGIDPSAPPWAWEVWRGGEERWKRVEVLSDSTGGLNRKGDIRLLLPDQCEPRRLGLYEAQTWVRCLPRGNSQHQYARPPVIRHMDACTIGITVPVTHAQPVGPEILGISNGQPGQRFRLQHPNVLPLKGPQEVIEVASGDGGWQAWQKVDDFGASQPDDRHYVFDPIAGEVEFGPAVRQRNGRQPQFGAVPPRDCAIRIRRYRIGGGVQGNVAADRVVVLKSTVPYVAEVTNRLPITGGLDVQSLDDAKLRAPSLLRTRHRAVTAEDFEHLAREVEGVGRVRCLQPRPDAPDSPPPGTVELLVIPAMPSLDETELERLIDLHESMAQGDGLNKAEVRIREQLQLPDATVLRLRAYLDERRLLTTRLSIRQPEYVWAMVQTRIKPLPKAEPERVRRDVKKALYRFLHPLYGGSDHEGWPFAQPLTPDKVYALIQAVPGVEYATELKLYPINMVSTTGERLKDSAAIIPSPPNGVIVSYYHNVYVGSRD